MSYILALTAMWSPSFLFIKLAVHDLPALTVAASRVAVAGLGLYLVLRWKGLSLPRDRMFWFHSLIMALASAAIPYPLFCFAEKSIDSAMASIVNGATPIFTALLAHAAVASDRLTLPKTLGIAMSSMGLLVLFNPGTHGGFAAAPLGMAAATAAAFCYAIGHVYAKKYVVGNQASALIPPTAQLLVSALLLLPLAWWRNPPLSMSMPSWEALVGLCGLTLCGTFLANIFYYKLLEHSGPTAVSMVACFYPLGGMILGHLFLGEKLSLVCLFAATLIMGGIAVVNEMFPWRRARPQVVVSQ